MIRERSEPDAVREARTEEARSARLLETVLAVQELAEHAGIGLVRGDGGAEALPGREY